MVAEMPKEVARRRVDDAFHEAAMLSPGNVIKEF